MSRRKNQDYTRDVGVDPIYHSALVQRLVNVVMERGKKNVAQAIVYGALDICAKKVGGKPEAMLELFETAYAQIIPTVEVRARRVGGSVYQIPVEIREQRARSLALRWLVAAAKTRSNKTMSERLGYELLEALEGRGGAVKKKIDMHKMAESNRAFAHYAW